MKSETVRPASQQQLQDIIATMIGGIPRLSHADAQAIIGKKGRLVRGIRAEFGKYILPRIPGTWACIFIGGESKEALLKRLSSTRMKIWAQAMIEHPSFVPAEERTLVGLVLMTVSGLGFLQPPTTEEIFERGQSLGLKLCHPEVGPRLWLEQMCEDGSYNIAMDPIPDCDKLPSIFYLSFDTKANGNGINHWLHGDSGLKRRWSLDSKLIFTML